MLLSPPMTCSCSERIPHSGSDPDRGSFCALTTLERALLVRALLPRLTGAVRNPARPCHDILWRQHVPRETRAAALTDLTDSQPGAYN